MCGIAGVFSDRPVETWRLQRALDSMQLRGPDDQGCWWSADGCVGLGHRRLAISQPSRGRQPITLDGCTVVVNGEFYGLDSETGGRSDSWALPVLYRRHELSGTLDRLRGEFAFLLYDERRKELLAVRDRFGIKPLYYGKREHEWWFASKPSALWAAGLRPGWCELSFVHAAHTQYAPPGHSLFKGIRSLSPAHFLRFPSPGDPQRYWQVPLASRQVSSRRFLAQLRESVHTRVRKGAPTAILLSGGVDSAAVLALAAESGEEVKAFTMDFPGAGSYSEARRAREQALHSGVDHTVVSLTSSDILHGLARAVHLTEGLCVNGHLVAKLKLAEAVAGEGRQVMLTGEGSDELLFGYRHFAPYFHRTVDPLADPAGLGILTTTERSPLPPSFPAFFHSKWALGKRICALMGLPHRPMEAFEKLRGECLRETPLDSAREAWLQTALAGYILEVLGDGTEMACSVEGRPPYLDHTLWELAIRPPDGEKSLLRDSLDGLLIEDIRKADKHPFMAPALGPQLLTTLRATMEDHEHPFVDRKVARETLDKVETMEGLERLAWEPAMLWVLSSHFLQGRFQKLPVW